MLKADYKIWLLILMLCFSACKDEEEILPEQTPSEQTAVDPPPTQDPPKSTDSTDVDSAFYRTAKFETMPYRIMLPRRYDSAKLYPLVIVLHGIDERGTDNKRQLTWGSSLFKSDSISTKYPSFVVFPQCPTTHYWFDQTPMDLVTRMIDKLVKTNNIDPKRIYIVGLSMGAYGTYALVARNPELFSKAVAIAGDGDPAKAPRMKKPAWQIFAGKNDPVVPSSKSEKMAFALRESGASVRLTIYPNSSHVDSWVKAFREPDFCSWLFAITKRRDSSSNKND